MTVDAPAMQPRSSSDLSVPRVAVRSRGDAGFIFVNNYVRGAQMPVRRAAQFQIRLPGSDAKPGVTLAIPRHPIDLPSGAYFIWPFNLRIEGITLRYARRNCSRGLKTPESRPSISRRCPESRRSSPSMRPRVRSVKRSSGESATDSGVVLRHGTQARRRLFDRRCFLRGQIPPHRRAHSERGRRRLEGAHCRQRPSAHHCAGLFGRPRCPARRASVCVLSPIRTSNSPSRRRHPFRCRRTCRSSPAATDRNAAFTADVPQVACRIAIDRDRA